MDRRAFLFSMAGGLLAAGCGKSGRSKDRTPEGDLYGTSHRTGHLLREGRFPPPSETVRTPIAIVGAGIGGLSAGWRLQRAGFGEFLVFEMEREAGGNSRFGENAVSAYPWGAHYLPLPTVECRAVRELLADLGVLQGTPDATRPRYDERYLCAAPQERLYRNGWWQEGLMPHAGVSAAERGQQARFQDRMAAFKAMRGADGRKAFALPLDLSSRDLALRALDRLSMRDWLMAEGFDAPTLHWYVNYACRDDYGTDYSKVSAWAGVHYFACRDGAAEQAADEVVLTRPEGNGWITRALTQRLAQRLQTGALVHRLHDTGKAVEIDVFLPDQQRSLRVVAAQAIWAAPLFLLAAVSEGLPPELAAAARSLAYAPWLVANLTLGELPAERGGAPLAWDNVLYGSPALGYVVATHQQIRVRPGPTVLTYYHALAAEPPAGGRQRLLETSREAWAEYALADLEKPHPGIRRLVGRIDVFRNGHAMVQPVPGMMWGEARTRLAAGLPRLHIAHADASGLSLFEEANYRGVLAAERALQKLGAGPGRILA